MANDYCTEMTMLCITSPCSSRIRMFFCLLAIIVMEGFFAGLAQAEEVTTQTLYYRPAEEVASRLQQVFPDEQARFSGLHNQLIIHARDAATLQQVREIIKQIDTRPHQFRISLRQQGDRSRQSQEIGAGGTISRDGSRVQITTRHGAFSNQGQSQQMVTVLENNAVVIQQGQLRPIRDFWVSRQGVATNTRFQQIGNALVVTPRRVGDGQVELSIHASHSRPGDRHEDQVEQMELVTQRIVGFGDWVELGSVRENVQEQRDGTIHYSTRREQQTGGFEIKVELID